MLSIQISDIKDFMSHLLSKDTFDHFYFIEASIKMGVSYQIQGRINEGFYDTSVEQTLNREFCYWKEIRHRILILLKENGSLSPAKSFSDFQSNPFPI